MSKLTDALHKAERERHMMRAGFSPFAGQLTGATMSQMTDAKFSGYFQALKQELQDEIRWVEEAVKRREPIQPKASAEAASVSAPAAPKPAAPVLKAAAPMPVGTILARPAAAPVAPVSAPAEAVKIQPHANISPAAWDQAIATVKDQLQTCEQQSARQTGDQVRFKAQLGALDQLIAQLQKDRDQLRQQLEQTGKSSTVLEATKAALSRQLDALRECQVLAYDVRMADQECQASAAVVAHVSQSNQRLASELAHYQDRTNALQQQAQQLKFKLAQAMASASTTPPAAPQPTTESS